jgi:RNase P subunit RPR2
MIAALAAVEDAPAQLIRCKSPSCPQVLATVGVRGDVYPKIVGAYWDKDGRCIVTCPACGTENRLPVRRRG